MAVKLTSLRLDAQRQNDGEWVEFPEHMDPETGEVPALRVRGATYGPFQAQMSILVQRWTRKYGTDPVPTNVSHEGNGRLYADHILLEWRGFAEPYSPEFARDWLLNPDSRPLHMMIRQAVDRVGAVEAEFVRDAAKNSQRSSDGVSATE